MTDKAVGVGLIGCGVISSIYLENAKHFAEYDVVAVADLDRSRAEAQAEKYGVPKVCSVEEVLADPSVDIVLNLTVPNAHAEIGMAALEAGKHLYSEKPLTIEREDAACLIAVAASKGMLVGSAPDTFLGGGLQTCRKLIDDGAIGQPVAATAFMFSHGPESWHANPLFFYQYGGGPLLDMGPYYITALVALFGPVRRVTGSARASFPERTIGSEPLKGQKITVDVPTHVAGILDFQSGAIATLMTTFDVWTDEKSRFEVFGSAGSLKVPDPNRFGGPVQLLESSSSKWRDVDLTHGSAENNRGIGLADMAAAARDHRPHRANGAMASHVLDVLHGILQASETGHHVDITSSCERPAPLPAGLADWVV
ncbi:MAG: Gfo/Idh/MocA family protein [Thermomicrobiales bacterium]